MPEAVIVDLGSGNLHSVEKALVRAGATTRVSGDPVVVDRARAIVLPGQGAFGEGMKALHQRGLEPVLRDAWQRGVPTFGICLGLQLLFEGSEEAPGVPGLGVIEGQVKRFPAGAGHKIPHMGWNDASGEDPLWSGSHQVYFVHSYYCDPVDPAVTALRASHAGVTFCAAARVGSIFATQFHPEKSQTVGLGLLSRFVSSLC